MITTHNLFRSEEDIIRQTGRTTRMVKSLPTDGCYIVVWKLGFANSIKRLIAEHRPDIDPRTVRFISGVSRDHVMENLRGTNLPVYVDHVTWYVWNEKGLKQFNLYYDRKL